jgi:hypothetical protein
MGRDRQVGLKAKDLQGFGYLNPFQPLLQRLHDNGVDRCGNRELFFDQYVSLLLLYFFNPILTSLNGLQQATRLAKVQQLIGGGPFSLGTLSAAQHAFDPALLEGLFDELVERIAPRDPPKEWEVLKNLVAVDGSLLPGLPRMTWALWQADRPQADQADLRNDLHILPGLGLRTGA